MQPKSYFSSAFAAAIYAPRPMQEKRIHQIFVVSVLFKGLHALIEIVGGVALYLVSTETIVHAINRWSYDELAEDRRLDRRAICSSSRSLLGRRAQFLRFLPAQPRPHQSGRW